MKRYDLVYGPDVEESENGEFVKWEDVKELTYDLSDMASWVHCYLSDSFGHLEFLEDFIIELRDGK